MSLPNNFSRSLASVAMFCAVLFFATGFADAQNTNIFDGSTDATWTGANWNVNGTSGQIVTPTITGDATTGYTYGPNEDWIVGAAGAGVTISEAVQIALDGGTLNVVDSTISLDSEAHPTYTGNMSSLNLGITNIVGGPMPVANFTNSTLNVTRSGSGNGGAINIQSGSTVVFDSTDLNATSFNGATLNNGADINVRETSTVTFQNGSNVRLGDDFSIGQSDNVSTVIFNNSTLAPNAGDIGDNIVVRGTLTFENGSSVTGMEQIRSHSDTDGTVITFSESSAELLFIDLDDGPGGAGTNRLLFTGNNGNTMTLSDANPLRGDNGNFDWVVTGAGTSILTSLDNTDATQDLAGRLASGRFSLNGVLVDPTTAYGNTDADIALINDELLTTATSSGVGTLYFQLAGTFDGSQSLQVFVVPVPEPSSCVVLGLGLMGLLVRRRR